MICTKCYGTGEYLGNGFILTDCDCDKESISEDKSSISLKDVDRRSKSYKKAIDDIMAINKDITREQAVKMFDEAYTKN
jgi:hypothetical protein